MVLNCRYQESVILKLRRDIDVKKFVGSHHTNEDFAVRGKEPKDEVQIYTWKDANLRELTDLVKEVAPAARRRNAKLSFAIVYPDRHGHFVVKEFRKFDVFNVKVDCIVDLNLGAISDTPIIKREKVGRTLSYGNGRLDDAKVLAELGFAIGDYLDVAIM
ncbi:SIN3 associated polypeptide P18 [Prunus dulcis]|uniref:SIN3 associated polypeptide P18 n=1 Tax=Prunus dulcis TaxID=3755 RepID=A0A4Y1R005_PRUDU|nr:SIN3 associated polypeptide P18 [Prunus dulcis]